MWEMSGRLFHEYLLCQCPAICIDLHYADRFGRIQFCLTADDVLEIYKAPWIRVSEDLWPEAAQGHLVDERMVHLEVHVLVLGEELDGYGVSSRSEAGFHGVGVSPVVPVPHASVRHHHCACALAVDEDGADGTFVLGVHRAVAVGIA